MFYLRPVKNDRVDVELRYGCYMRNTDGLLVASYPDVILWPSIPYWALSYGSWEMFDLRDGAWPARRVVR